MTRSDCRAADPQSIERVMALRRAGKNLDEISEEMHTSHRTVVDILRKYMPEENKQIASRLKSAAAQRYNERKSTKKAARVRPAFDDLFRRVFCEKWD